jgi:hypothetical protein
VFLNYPCILSASISPDNREYTVVPTILVKSPKVPRVYEPLNLALADPQGFTDHRLRNTVLEKLKEGVL